MNRTSLANVWEIRNGNDVQHAPDKIGLLAFHLASDLLASPTVGAITANNVLGMDHFSGSSGNVLTDTLRSVIWRECAAEQAIWC